MADFTRKLGLPYLSTSQAQKEITHNEALDIIDFFCQPVVKSRTSSPPGTPAEGDAYIVLATATGVWVGKDNTIARYINGSWTFYTPFEGMWTWVVADVRDYVYHSSAWMPKP